MDQILVEALFYLDKTSEYSEIYREQLTSEHFLPSYHHHHLHYRLYLGISADFYDSVEGFALLQHVVR
jgi:hypothetical protein